jgi:hypothetical protein
MTSRRKVTYAGVIALGVAVMAIDRLTGDGNAGEPASAEAAELPRAPRPTPTRDPAGQPVRVEAAAFPRDLPSAALSGPPRDPFALTVELLEALAPPQEPANVAAPRLGDPRVQSLAERFAAEHTLSAVLVSADGASVIVNAQILQVGESVDGCVLQSVTGHTALFQCQNQHVILAVETFPGQNSN